MNSKTCAQKGDHTFYGMYAKYVKENHVEMYGGKWDRFNEAKSSSTNGVSLLQTRRRHCLLCVSGPSGASLRRTSLQKEYDTGVADDRRMGSDGILCRCHPSTYLRVSSSGSVFF